MQVRKRYDCRLDSNICFEEDLAETVPSRREEGPFSWLGSRNLVTNSTGAVSIRSLFPKFLQMLSLNLKSEAKDYNLSAVDIIVRV